MLCQGILDLEKAVKGLSARNKRDPENNKTRPSQRIGGVIMSHPIMSMGT
jgi:hypothetical protein